MLDFHYHPHHHDDDDDEDDQNEDKVETFHRYFWRRYKSLIYGAVILLALGLPIFFAGHRYSHRVHQPICGCETDKDYCCPTVFNNPDSGAHSECHANQCYCYKRNPYTELRSGDYFCMPLAESQSFETYIVEEPSPFLLMVGFVCLLVGLLSLTVICWSIPSEQRTHEALEIQREMSLLESRLRVAMAAMRKTPHTHTSGSSSVATGNPKKPEYQKLPQVELV